MNLPTIEAQTRAQFRLAHRNERALYKRTCDKTGESIVSVFSEDKSDTVWKYEEWQKDDWDPLSYGRNYDTSRPFFDQFKELQQIIPKPSLLHARSINSSYLNLCADNKNCYMLVESSNNEDCMNCYWIQKCLDCYDVSFSHQCELCVECDDCFDCYRTQESQSCHNCSNYSFCVDCHGCMDCVGCVGLRHQQFCIYNEQYDEDSYNAKLTELGLATYSGRVKFRKSFAEFAEHQPRKYAEIVNAPGCNGNYIKNAKNCIQCFHCYDAEDCKYGEHVWRTAKDCMDVSTAGRNAELVYNSLNTGINVHHCVSFYICWSCVFTEYSQYCSGCTNCFGCFGLTNKEYCILNSQYSKEEYEQLRKRIIATMKEKEEYGAFFPPRLSLFVYNEIVAQEQYPLEREDAEVLGFRGQIHREGRITKKQ